MRGVKGIRDSMGGRYKRGKRGIRGIRGSMGGRYKSDTDHTCVESIGPHIR